jgi:hypothetical protein
MATPDAGSVDLPIATFGGKVSQFDPQALPIGASPLCQDVIFSGVNPSGQGVVGGVASRPGMQAFYAAPFAGNPTVNYLKTFVDTAEVFHLLSLDSLGVMRDESPCPTVPGVPATIGNVVAASIAQSDTLFGREWIAISSPAHPGFGIDIPRQWDGTNFDRVSQVGPGAPPIASDELAIAYTIKASALGLANPSTAGASMSESGNVVTITGIAAPVATALQIGDFINVTSAGQPGYNGTFTIASVVQVGATATITYINPTTGLPGVADGAITFYLITVTLAGAPLNPFAVGQLVTIAGAGVAGYNGNWQVRSNGAGLFITSGPGSGLANSGGGTITNAGSVAVGLHQLSVCFITRQNYITKPAPYGSFIASGNKRVTVSQISTGPANVVARILIFTPVIVAPATSGPFFYFNGPVQVVGYTYPSMVIGDNTTTTLTVDFTDAVLQLGTTATKLFNLLELGECAKSVAYSSRIFWSGERNKLPNFVNTAFDGGPSSGFPLGWTPDAVNSAGGATTVGGNWLNAYTITGDGATAIRGKIAQSAFQDFLGVTILKPNTQYSVRVWLAWATLIPVAGTFHIDLFSPTAGLVAGGFSKAGNTLTNIMTEYIGTLTTSAGVGASVPSDLVLRVYMDGTLTNTSQIKADSIEVYPTAIPYNNNVIRVSYANDPESFDQLTGYIIVGQAQGQSVRTMFLLLDNKLYIETERGLYNTADDGQNEPSLWTVSTVSNTVGTGSVRGVGVGESWAVIASHDGAYIFWGGEPVKISQEIQPDWDTINWLYDQTIYVVVDTARKRIHIGTPTGASTTPNLEFVCDYSQLANAEGTTAAQDIASHPQAYYSTFQPTKLVAPGKARKWTVWNVAANSAALTIRSDGSYHLFRGNATGTGKVYDQVTTQYTDDGALIFCQYQTAFFPQIEDEQVLQLGSHRKTFKYLTGFAFGVGTVLGFNVSAANSQRIVTLSTLPINQSQKWDFEKNVNFIGERMSITVFGFPQWELTKLCPTVQRDIITPVRGVA